MSSKLPYKQAANVERRTWDRDTYEAKAKARQESENGAGDTNNMKQYQGNKRPLENDEHERSTGTSSETIPVSLREEEKEEFQTAEEGAACPWRSKRAFLKSRRGKVDLDSKVGRTEIINPDAAAASSTADGGESCVSITDGVTKGVNGVGWHCKVCDCFLKDSLAYLDHINGRKHQRKLGYSMRVEKSTTNEVVSKLDQLARDQKAKMNEAALAALSNNKKNDQEIGDEDVNQFEEMVKKKDEDAAQRKADRKRRRAERKKKARGEIANTSNENAVLVGDSNIVDEAENVGEILEKEDGVNPDKQNDDDGGGNPDIMAMMGFSGFGN